MSRTRRPEDPPTRRRPHENQKRKNGEEMTMSASNLAVACRSCAGCCLGGRARDRRRPEGEIAPTGKLRVAIAISTAGGAFWSSKTEAGGYAGVPVDLGKEMAAQLGVPVEYVAYQNSGQITDVAAEGRLGRHVPAAGPVRVSEDGVRPDLPGHGCDLHRQGGFGDHEFRNARPARRQGRGRIQHHDHARCCGASEECEGDRVPDLRRDICLC